MSDLKDAHRILDRILDVVVARHVHGEHEDELGEDICRIIGLDAEKMFNEGGAYDYTPPWHSDTLGEDWTHAGKDLDGGLDILIGSPHE